MSKKEIAIFDQLALQFKSGFEECNKTIENLSKKELQRILLGLLADGLEQASPSASKKEERFLDVGKNLHQVKLLMALDAEGVLADKLKSNEELNNVINEK